MKMKKTARIGVGLGGQELSVKGAEDADAFRFGVGHTMSWRRGLLLRLWLALSLCWIVAVGVYVWTQEPWIWSRQWVITQTDPEVKVDLGGQRVKIGREFLNLSPEQKNELIDEIRATITGFGTYATRVTIAFGIPLAVLILGYGIRWVAVGLPLRTAAQVDARNERPGSRPVARIICGVLCSGIGLSAARGRWPSACR